jgi:hypothetical protein
VERTGRPNVMSGGAGGGRGGGGTKVATGLAKETNKHIYTYILNYKYLAVQSFNPKWYLAEIQTFLTG